MNNIYPTREAAQIALNQLTKAELYKMWVPITHQYYDLREMLSKFMIDDILDIWFPPQK